MDMKTSQRSGQQGVMLIEALIAILLFSTGILAMIAMQGLAISYSADAKYRTDAAFFANELLGQMWVDRANIGTYAYPGGTAPALGPWKGRIDGMLPGTAANPPVINVDVATGAVDITIRWQAPNADSARSYRTVAIIVNP
jgi:type IV pilus assembly protein PilV